MLTACPQVRWNVILLFQQTPKMRAACLRQPAMLLQTLKMHAASLRLLTPRISPSLQLRRLGVRRLHLAQTMTGKSWKMLRTSPPDIAAVVLQQSQPVDHLSRAESVRENPLGVHALVFAGAGRRPSWAKEVLKCSAERRKDL